MVDALVSEWLKIRSVRSTLYVLAVLAVVVLLAGALTLGWLQSWDNLAPERRATAALPPAMDETLLPLVQLCLAVLGVVAITAEYTTGMIRTSLIALPQRGTLLAAKSLVVAAVALAVGQVTVLAMFLVVRIIASAHHIPDYQTPAYDDAATLLSLGASMAVFALTGLGLGAALRSTAGATAATCTLLLVFPRLSGLLPAPWDDRVTAVMLPNLPAQLTDPNPGATGLPPLGALVVLVAYAAAALAAGAAVLGRRDA